MVPTLSCGLRLIARTFGTCVLRLARPQSPSQLHHRCLQPQPSPCCLPQVRCHPATQHWSPQHLVQQIRTAWREPASSLRAIWASRQPGALALLRRQPARSPSRHQPCSPSCQPQHQGPPHSPSLLGPQPGQVDLVGCILMQTADLASPAHFSSFFLLLRSAASPGIINKPSIPNHLLPHSTLRAGVLWTLCSPSPKAMHQAFFPPSSGFGLLNGPER